MTFGSKILETFLTAQQELTESVAFSDPGLFYAPNKFLSKLKLFFSEINCFQLQQTTEKISHCVP